ncbi:MAG: glyoxylate/hydroxypyruvate reductase A [Rhizobiales bacterium]|nr:glyoxylate/hydroxypyruvate reductase A [Hyphomicrobiales bacterium]NRB14222.1 glyoxylate/hydroxypyruvate reductase A [Hyphomicrobiales bacterium]
MHKILIASLKQSNQGWYEGFCAMAPQVSIDPNEIAYWPQVKDLNQVEYLAVWKPPHDICAQLPNLKAIFNLGAGVDHLLLDDSLPKHLPIVRIVDENLTRRMGEYILLQSLYHLRSMGKLRVAQHQKIWLNHYDPDAADVCIGIMGLGELGSHCAKLLHQLGFKTIGWSNSAKNIAGIDSYAGPAELEAFLGQTEILINLLPHTQATEKMVTYEFLGKLNHTGALGGASYIAAGRGKTHVEVDIARALRDGRLKSASMDVFEQEPLAQDSPLWGLDNLVLTPHNSATSDRKTVSLQILQQIANHRQGGALKNIVDLKRGY